MSAASSVHFTVLLVAMRPSLVLGASGTALAIYACGACGHDSATGAGTGTGGHAASAGVTTSSTPQSSSATNASGSGAAGSGGGGCWSVDPPASMPKGWAELADRSCHCRFYHEPDPKSMVETVPCGADPEKPNGIHCRFVKVDWESRFVGKVGEAV